MEELANMASIGILKKWRISVYYVDGRGGFADGVNSCSALLVIESS